MSSTQPMWPPIRRAVMRAVLAPSIHNTQPWQFIAAPGVLDVFADPGRRLAVIDPTERAMFISCGAAVLGARLSLAADGLSPTCVLLPDKNNPYHVARIQVSTDFEVPDPDAAALDRAADRRHTNRRSFTSEAVPASVVDRLQAAADLEHAFLAPIRSGMQRQMVSGLAAEAENQLFARPAYRAELRRWAGRPGDHDDGIPVESIPASGRTSPMLAARDFDLRGTGRLPGVEQAPGQDCALILATDTDDRRAWLHAGQALARILLHLTNDDLVAALVTEFAELHATRDGVRSTLNLGGYPHVLLRIGHAPAAPATPRRPLPDVLTERLTVTR